MSAETYRVGAQTEVLITCAGCGADLFKEVRPSSGVRFYRRPCVAQVLTRKRDIDTHPPSLDAPIAMRLADGTEVRFTERANVCSRACLETVVATWPWVPVEIGALRAARPSDIHIGNDALRLTCASPKFLVEPFDVWLELSASESEVAAPKLTPQPAGYLARLARFMGLS